MDIEQIQELKAKADREVGALVERLNACGARGNTSVQLQLARWEGRSAALAEILSMAAVASR